ncbi:thymidine phosphorylase family protein [Pseudaestuariivita atlantica]|uniref:Putative thymidine phosphorylase n=1 Tax=Pseudaestuariivita atlantica TaxID=1317121 RepID=A0A0L1JT43_9RHOB|nr:thymidine phosphorylase family protein [Pseudaestuariivita atlantica]KNG94578.1 thymidine phosphorylase [Pseudaestuariivita atlantica]
MTEQHDRMPLVPANIDTYRHPVVYMHEDCHLCRSEGFTTQTRIEIELDGKRIIATLNVITGEDWLPPETAALSNTAWEAMTVQPGAVGRFSHPEPPASASSIRAKVYGGRLDEDGCRAIISDTVQRRLSDLDLGAFVTSCAGDRLDTAETTALTLAMRDAGARLDWGAGPVLDKHCVGGLPGNRTTPIVVAIVAAAGHLIPKTSSRAITSPAGTADTMEVMAPVALDQSAMRRVVEAEGGCIVWGGGLDLSPADDMLIRIERPLDFDSEGLMVASILSKKAAAGSSHVLIDMPVGPTAKVRSDMAAQSLSRRLTAVAGALGQTLAIHRSDGSTPVGLGIGPALEAHDVLAVLRRDPQAPADLRARALDVAGALLDMAGTDGRARAADLLDGGAAEARFMAICAAQGGFREPGTAPQVSPVTAARAGTITAIDNRRIAKIAKLAGAPGRKTSGVRLHARVGDTVAAGQPLFSVHAETRGELSWALDYAASGDSSFVVEDAP